MIQNSAKSPPISADEQPDFLGQSTDKKTFSANRDSSTLNFKFKFPPFWSHDADSWLALCKAKFTIAGIEAPVLKLMTILETLTTDQLKKLYVIPKSQDPGWLAIRNCALR